MGGPEYRIVVRGLFEPVAFALSTMSALERLRHNESHVLFTISSTAVALARPIGEGWSTEVLVLDPTGGMIASNFAELLRGLLGFEVTGPVRRSPHTPTPELYPDPVGTSPVPS
jgi:hypothetical protein